MPIFILTLSQLNIKRPVREVIANTCAIFGIQDVQRQHFWLPRGKRNIIQKYGGKPVRSYAP